MEELKILEFELLESDEHSIKNSFANFLKKPSSYKNKFLQSEFNIAFDGYSFLGQEDSLNQYATDMLHSFVISDLQEISKFPIEFQGFLKSKWPQLLTKVKQLERSVIKEKNLPFEEMHSNGTLGYMMSCNYYPVAKTQKTTAKNNTRLSAHTDVSLFTTFPFGIPEGLSYLNNEERIDLGKRNNTISFPGYFSEFISNGEIKALNHQVEIPINLDEERFSFAIFSIPKPEATFQIGNQKVNGKQYYENYLNLF